MVKNVTLKINSNDIPLNPFVKDVFDNVIRGLVDTLDKIPEKITRIELKIEKEDDK